MSKESIDAFAHFKGGKAGVLARFSEELQNALSNDDSQRIAEQVTGLPAGSLSKPEQCLPLLTGKHVQSLATLCALNLYEIFGPVHNLSPEEAQSLTKGVVGFCGHGDPVPTIEDTHQLLLIAAALGQLDEHAVTEAAA